MGVMRISAVYVHRWITTYDKQTHLADHRFFTVQIRQFFAMATRRFFAVQIRRFFTITLTQFGLLLLGLIVVVSLSVRAQYRLQPGDPGESFSDPWPSARSSSSSSSSSDPPAQLFHLRAVPLLGRFDNPWCIPTPVTLPTLRQSRHRLLFSPVRTSLGAGLGHGMAIVNAEVSTALQFGLTYTHRIGKYAHLSEPPADPRQEDETTTTTRVRAQHEEDQSQSSPFRSAGAVERLFGWGVGEIPRVQLFPALCGPGFAASEHLCSLCNGSWATNSSTSSDGNKISITTTRRLPRYAKYNFRIDHVVEIPVNLSYKYRPRSALTSDSQVEAFLRQHPHPYTVFTMPAELCAEHPAYSFFSPQARSFYFHKYWSAHGGPFFAASSTSTNSVYLTDLERKQTFVDFYRRITANRVFPPLGARPQLSRLNASELNIAVHARRGDFLLASNNHRTMISMRAIGHLVRSIIANVIKHKPQQMHTESSPSSTFARMPISLSIYSQGRSTSSMNSRISSHDVSYMSSDFVDSDGQLLSAELVRDIVLNGDWSGDLNGSEQQAETRHGLPPTVEIKLRTSDDTILSVHEMVAADIFIGSSSGLSTHVVGSLSRAAFLLLATVKSAPSFDGKYLNRFVQFNSSTGAIRPDQVAKMRQLWEKFVQCHRPN